MSGHLANEGSVETGIGDSHVVTGQARATEAGQSTIGCLCLMLRPFGSHSDRVIPMQL
jgi:hypothetical protein